MDQTSSILFLFQDPVRKDGMMDVQAALGSQFKASGFISSFAHSISRAQALLKKRKFDLCLVYSPVFSNSLLKVLAAQPLAEHKGAKIMVLARPIANRNMMSKLIECGFSDLLFLEDFRLEKLEIFANTIAFKQMRNRFAPDEKGAFTLAMQRLSAMPESHPKRSGEDTQASPRVIPKTQELVSTIKKES